MTMRRDDVGVCISIKVSHPIARDLGKRRVGSVLTSIDVRMLLANGLVAAVTDCTRRLRCGDRLAANQVVQRLARPNQVSLSLP